MKLLIEGQRISSWLISEQVHKSKYQDWLRFCVLINPCEVYYCKLLGKTCLSMIIARLQKILFKLFQKQNN